MGEREREAQRARTDYKGEREREAQRARTDDERGREREAQRARTGDERGSHEEPERVLEGAHHAGAAAVTQSDGRLSVEGYPRLRFFGSRCQLGFAKLGRRLRIHVLAGRGLLRRWRNLRDLVRRRGRESPASALHDKGGDSASDAHANVLPPSAAAPGRHGGGNTSNGFKSSGEQWWCWWERWTTRIHQVSSHSGCVPGKAQRTTAAVRPCKRITSLL